MGYIETTLHNQNVRMTNIEHQITELIGLKQNMTHVQSTVQIMDQNMKEITHKIRDYDQSIQIFCDMYDDIKSDKRRSDSLVNKLCDQIEQLQIKQRNVKAAITKAESSITDIQCKSMRDNLIFTGIREQECAQREFEDTERALQNFLKHEMKIEKPIQFRSVHKINNTDRNIDYPRPIIAKFERPKDREYVRMLAPKTFTDKPFGVREQFPKVIEEKRKLLYPEMKRARKNKDNKVRLVRDRLFINDIECVPNINKDRQEKRQPEVINEVKTKSGTDKTQQIITIVRTTSTRKAEFTNDQPEKRSIILPQICRDKYTQVIWQTTLYRQQICLVNWAQGRTKHNRQRTLWYP